MKKRFLAVLFVVISVLCCMTACDKKDDDSTKPKPNPNPGYDVVEDNEAHYLIFMVEANEVEKMLVVSTDNYENLEPYFPTVPEKEGFVGYWEDIDEVYSSTQKEIYINAYYVKNN